MSKTVKLIEIAKKIGSGITPRRDNNEYWEGGTIPWLKTEQLGEYKIYDTSEKITQIALSETSIKIFPANTLSIAMYGEGRTRGNISILKSPMTTNQACCNVVIDKDKADYEYVYYFLKTQYKQLRSLSSGVRNNLNSNDIKEFEIRLPNSITTQQNIASVLSSLDSKIELNNRINRELEQMAKLLYDYWFVQFEFPNAEGKPYKTSGGKMDWNEELKREIPEGWKVGELKDIANITMGQSPPGESYNENGEGMIFFQGCTDFGNRFPTVRKFTTQPSRFANEGDILLSVRAPVGTINIAKENCCIGRGLASLNSKDDCIAYLFGVMINLKQIFDRRNVDGTTFGSITKDDLFSLKVIVPDKEVLKRYQEIIKPAFEKQNKIELENQQLASLRDWLLPMLMNGQVTVGSGVNSSDDSKSSDELAATAVYEQEEKLGMVAEPVPDYKKDIAKLTKQEAFLRKLMLASHIVYELCEEPTFGHTKLMKLLYLSEQVGGMALQTNYKKFAAGPFDGKTLTLIDQEYKKNGWFILEKRSYSICGQQREATIYKKTEKSLCYKKHFDNYFEQESASIDKLISLFRSEKTQIAEVVATLYFAWKELLAKRTILSENILIKAFYEFHKEKKKFTKEQIMDGYHFMLKHGVHPK